MTGPVLVINGTVTGVEVSSRYLEDFMTRTEIGVAMAVFRTGAALMTQVKANASGRPGPNVQLGDYRGSIHLNTLVENGRPVAAVATTMPQGPRLEYGFNGADALGRRFRQAPLPHWRPAVEKYEPILSAAIRDAVGQAAKGSISFLA